MSGSFLRRISQWDYLVISTFVLLAFSLFLGGASREHALPLAAIELISLPVLGLALVRHVETGVWKNHRFLLILAGLATAVPLLQLLPLPYALWTSIPGRDQAVLALQTAGLQPGWLPYSLTPDQTWQHFLAILPPVAMLLAGLLLEKDVLRALLWIVLGFVVVAIGLGALQITLTSRTVYPWETTNFGSLVGFFANRNHMATLCLIAMPFAAAFAGSALGDRSRRDRSELVVWLGGGVLALAIVALGAIQSRFGVAAALPVLVASLVVGWMASGRGRLGMRSMAIISAATLALAAVAVFALDPILDRFEDPTEFDGRFDRWPTVAEAAQDHLPLGSGLGSFDPVYRSYEPVETLRHAYFNQAHNDYLETWLTTGWIGIGLILAFYVWWGRRSLVAWRASSHLDRDLQRAASIALLIIAVHSFADYPLRTETIAVLFALGCAVLERAGQLSPRKRKTRAN